MPTPTSLPPLYEWVMRGDRWVLVDRNSEPDFTGKLTALDYDTENQKWIDAGKPDLGPPPHPMGDAPGGLGREDEDPVDPVDPVDDVDDVDDVDEGFQRPSANYYTPNPVSPFAMMQPWAAWNALPNMINQLQGTMDYWLTKNQRQMLEKSKLWTALRMMAMITGHDYNPETGEYNLPGQPFDGDGGGSGGGGVAGGGLGPSSVVNVASSPTSPTYAAYGKDRTEVNTAPFGSFPQMAQSAFSKLRSGIGGGGALNDIMSQGLLTAGNQARTGIVEPALMAGQADTQAARDSQIAQQTIAGGRFASGLGAQQAELGLSAYETQMRKQLGLVGPMMQYMNPLQQSLMGSA